MDSLTQAALGATLAAGFAPANKRRTAIVVGAVLGTLPDLDSFIIPLLTGNPLDHITWHRGFTHSLPILTIVAIFIWDFSRKTTQTVREHPWRWFFAIWLPLFTHPLIDAMNAYATHLLWPLPYGSVQVGAVYVIDPLYTIWLLIAVIVALIVPRKKLTTPVIFGALIISTAYMGWAIAAQAHVKAIAQQQLRQIGMQNAAISVSALPTTTFLWRVIALTDEDYLLADYSLIADQGNMTFHAFPNQARALNNAADFAATRQFMTFSDGIVRTRVSDDGLSLILTDLKIGLEPDYPFQYVVAERESVDAPWREVEPRQIGTLQIPAIKPFFQQLYQRITTNAGQKLIHMQF